MIACNELVSVKSLTSPAASSVTVSSGGEREGGGGEG